MAAIKINTVLQNALLDGVLNTHAGNIFDGGTAIIEIRTGAQPANANTAASGTLLASCVIPTAAFNAAAAGAAAMSAQAQDANADATGTAGWARVRDAADTYRVDGDVTITAGGGFIELDSLAVTAGGQVTITTLSITQPGA